MNGDVGSIHCHASRQPRVKKPSKERAFADPHKKLLGVTWKRCWDDAKTTLLDTPALPCCSATLQRCLPGLILGRMRPVTGMNSETEAIPLLPVDPAQGRSIRPMIRTCHGPQGLFYFHYKAYSYSPVFESDHLQSHYLFSEILKVTTFRIRARDPPFDAHTSARQRGGGGGGLSVVIVE